MEQESGAAIDNVVPTEGFSKLPVVGLGCSAGGLSALQAFFSAMAPDCGMAFVVIMHLSPEHDSMLAELLQRTTTEVHAQSIEVFAPPSMIVNREHDLVHLSGDAGKFLHFSHGEPSTNLLRLIHPMLRVELRAAIFRAAQSGEVVETHGVPVEIDGARQTVDMRVAPTLPAAPGFLLVILTERAASEPAQPRWIVGGENAAPAIRELERELEQSKTTLRDTVEQSDASQEELKASNEELQAMNEELRSTSEELETGREELQSINEELTTVNSEMKFKVEELARANADLQNLMAATAIATVFLDRNLCIQRYTPPAVALST